MPPMLDRRTHDLLRELAPQVLGAVIRRFRDFAASEDAVQEALLAAATQWPSDGLPENPRAWLYQVAARRIADHVRAETARRQREAIVVSLVPPEKQLARAADDEDGSERDDALDLLFMCCHPVLSSSSAIALTLRAVERGRCGRVGDTGVVAGAGGTAARAGDEEGRQHEEIRCTRGLHGPP